MTPTTPKKGEPLNGESVRLLMPGDWQERYMELYARLSDMADRWDQAVFDHSLEPEIGDDWNAEANRRVLYECRPLADFERPTAQADKTAPEGECRA